MLVQHFLENTAQRAPSKTALVCDGGRFSYAAIDERANRLANALLARGLQRGDRVAIYLPNCADTVVAIFAILKAGATFVAVNPGVAPFKLARILHNCRAAALIARAPLFETAPSLRFTLLAGDLPAVEEQSPAARPPVSNIGLDLACLIYTSGSTGEPKGVMSDHCNVTFVSGSIIEYLRNTPDDIVLNTLPLSFDYGLYQLLMTFRFGGTLVLENSFAFPAAILQRIEQEKVTGFPGVPTIFAMLLQFDLSGFDLSSLRYITNTAAALPVSHILDLKRHFPGVRIYSMYGLTETKRTLYLPPEQLEVRPGSVGIPIPGTEAWLEDEEGNRLPPGGTGELVIRGSHVMRGYWNSPLETGHRFPPGEIPGERYCRSGDVFRTDREGYFYFVGRKDDIFKSRGEKVAPKEVEAVIYELPGVVEVAVVGVPDALLGHAVRAIVVRRGASPTEAEVIRHCKSRLEEFMVPRQVVFQSALPKSASGKIVRPELVLCAE